MTVTSFHCIALSARSRTSLSAFFRSASACVIDALAAARSTPSDWKMRGVSPACANDETVRTTISAGRTCRMETSIFELGEPVLRTVSRSEEHTSELQSQSNLVCRLLLEKKKNVNKPLQG